MLAWFQVGLVLSGSIRSCAIQTVWVQSFPLSLLNFFALCWRRVRGPALVPGDLKWLDLALQLDADKGKLAQCSEDLDSQALRE